jgi:DNA polymerase elongation subunit (family B)
MLAFIYHWYVNDELNNDGEKELCMRAYGIDEKNRTMLLHIKNFNPWIYVEVQKDNKTSKDWINFKSLIKNKIVERCKHLSRPNTFYFTNKKKLYFNDRNEYPFLKLRLNTIESRKKVYYSLNNYKFRVMGNLFVLKCHEFEATPVLQLMVSKNLPTAGWVQIKGNYVKDKISALDLEVSIDYNNISPITTESEMQLKIPQPIILSFDIEVYSSNSQRMPLAINRSDCIFQISCVTQHEKYLLTLCKTTGMVVGKNVIIQEFSEEKDLLLGFTALIRKINPHILIGYNIFGFDIPYMIARAKLHSVYHQFDLIGIPLQKHAPETEIKWSSTAYKHQEFHFLDAEGRIFIDLLPIVKRDYKFNNYKLKTVSTFFLGETKDPLTPQDIFKAYESGCKGECQKISECGKYCVQDSLLVLKLFNILQLWIGLSEMAKICNVPILHLFTKGQQIKVYSQVYKKCYYENILVESLSDHYINSDGGYAGAYVFPPEPGIYDWVIPFDFSSLYPTTIIAYNIDYSTLVLDESNVNINDCHVIEWEDHINCEHDLTGKKSGKKLCGHNRFLFKKEPIGIIPSMLMDLLNKRADTKKMLKKIKNDADLTKEFKDLQLIVLDKRQLAYKLSANSAYGAMGVKKGYLPFMPGAMSTTAMGRMSIQKASEFVKSKHNGQLIYGDSVLGDTPLAIKILNKIRILSIAELFQSFDASKTTYPEFKNDESGLYEKEKVEPSFDIWIMSMSGWSPIRKIIRHRTCKEIYRVITTTGSVDVTEDHSLLDKFGKMIKPNDLQMSQELFCLDSMKLWENNSIDFSIHELNDLDIMLDGGLVYKKNYETHKKEALMIYIFLLKKFDNIVIKVINGYAHYEICDWNVQGQVLEVQRLGKMSDFVYDIETMDGSFHAGVGNLIVKNTDSIYCHFHDYKNSHSSWSMAKNVEKDLLQLFPSPMKLVFEEKIYKKFLILTKKRYMAYTCGEDGVIDENLTIRGVLLARRDNCKWIRMLYEEVVRVIMDGANLSRVVEIVNDYILDLLQWKKMPMSAFIISKQVNKDYKIKCLPTDFKKFQKRMHDLNIYSYPSHLDLENINARIEDEKFTNKSPWLKTYIMRTKPGHIQLANKMNERGKPVEVGSRIEFLIMSHPDDPKAKLFEKLEDPIYFHSHRDILRIDRLYYIKSLAVPMDQLLHVIFKIENLVSSLYDHHLAHQKLMTQISKRPIILFDDEEIKPEKKQNKKIKKTIYDYM